MACRFGPGSADVPVGAARRGLIVPKQSAGILLYRGEALTLEVLLVHPGGPYWAKKDDGAWTVPKGEITAGESPLEAALRECAEEIGHRPSPPYIELPPVAQSRQKTVLVWAARSDLDPSLVVSNSFEMEWPPRSGRLASFPEVDRAEWFDLTTARIKLLAGQIPLLDHLVAALEQP